MSCFGTWGNLEIISGFWNIGRSAEKKKGDRWHFSHLKLQSRGGWKGGGGGGGQKQIDTNFPLTSNVLHQRGHGSLTFS